MAATTDTFDTQAAPGSVHSTTAGLVRLYAPDDRVPSVVLLVDAELLIGREQSGSRGLALPFGSVSRAHAKITVTVP